jgi:hypothetical protein
VPFAHSLDEIVLFELPDSRAAERLLKRVAAKRLAWLQGGESAAVVGVLLNPDELDLALLLRDAEAWLERSGLAAMRFEVDGRTYLLQARRPALATG